MPARASTVCIDSVNRRSTRPHAATKMRIGVRVKPWKEAGVTLADWRRAHRAVIRLVADLVWRARGSTGSHAHEREAAMQRLSRIAEGDPESTRYGLDLAQSEDERAER
jgi:hypothetical protein